MQELQKGLWPVVLAARRVSAVVGEIDRIEDSNGPLLSAILLL